MKLLLLEDDAETRDHVASLLRAGGHIVDAASDGRQAIELARARDHEVLVLDRMVPWVDGIAVLRCLREQGIAARRCS